MRYILFFFLLSSILVAQDREPAQRSFDLFGNSNYFIHSDSSYFNINNEIMLGWQWDEDYVTSEFFNTNFTLQKMWNSTKLNNVYTTSFFDSGARFVAATAYLTALDGYFSFTNSQSMWWEPTL